MEGNGVTTATTAADQSSGTSYSIKKRVAVALAAISLGVVVAGFWNYHAVDGFGRTLFAEPLVGDTEQAAESYIGVSFGLVFAVAAGLAATFTACNCVVFAMVPGLVTQSGDDVDRGGLLKTLGTFVGGVVLVGIVYGTFVGMLGPEGIEAMNTRAVRLAQAQTIFSVLGLGLLIWGTAKMGFLSGLEEHLSSETRVFLALPATQATTMGLFVGLFAVGRPFPVFRDLLTYAATTRSSLYGAAIMVINDLAMIAIMLLLFLILVRTMGDRIAAWAQQNPHGPQLLSGFALLAGGAYFVFYWGLALVLDIGSWGFKLGLYG